MNIPPLKATHLTLKQKLQALSDKYYSNLNWDINSVKPGDHYTTPRADLELYQVVAIQDGKVYTRYATDPDASNLAEWPIEDFLSDCTFGAYRVLVSDYIFDMD